MKIKIGPLTFDLEKLSEYNPNYLSQLPPKGFATFGNFEVTITDQDAIVFDKCVSVYLDYKIGSRPDTEEEISRRMKEAMPYVVL